MTEKEQSIDFPHSIVPDSELSAAEYQEAAANQTYEHPERPLATQDLHESLDVWRQANANLEQVRGEVGAAVSEQSPEDAKLAFLGRLRAAKKAEAGSREVIEDRLDQLEKFDIIERYVNGEDQGIDPDLR